MIQIIKEYKTENLFSNVDDYDKPILVESYFKSRGDKDKKLSVK